MCTVSLYFTVVFEWFWCFEVIKKGGIVILAGLLKQNVLNTKSMISDGQNRPEIINLRVRDFALFYFRFFNDFGVLK